MDIIFSLGIGFLASFLANILNTRIGSVWDLIVILPTAAAAYILASV